MSVEVCTAERIHMQPDDGWAMRLSYVNSAAGLTFMGMRLHSVEL